MSPCTGGCRRALRLIPRLFPKSRMTRWPPRWRRSSSSSPSSSSSRKTPTTGQDFVRIFEQDVLFDYMAGRWLWNENSQLLRRHVRFDLSHLIKAAAEAVQSQSCVEITKLSEGNFSKAFLMTMDDGKEVVAKLPNPNAGRPHDLTASEVATMIFAREVLKIPTPMIYSWSSTADNPVGAEFIIMERAKGVELSELWDNLSGPEKVDIVKKIVNFETRFVSLRYPMYGSIYLADDLPKATPEQIIPVDLDRNPSGRTYAVGPTTRRDFFDDGRNSAKTDLGPWGSIEGYLQARVERELACIEKSPIFPRGQGFFNAPNQYRPTGAYKTEVLLEYGKVARLLKPRDEDVSRAALWHPDLHTGNIFVDPQRPTEITAIIDWQASNLAPLFMQVDHPALVDFEGPTPESVHITLPSNYDRLDADQQLAARRLRAAQTLYKLYETQLMRQCDSLIHALVYQNSLPGKIMRIAGSVFTDGEVILHGMLVRLQDDWNKIVGQNVPCPLSFTQQQRLFQLEQEKKWKESVVLLSTILDQVGAYQGWGGWVEHESYEIMKQRLAQARVEFMTSHASSEEERLQWMHAWPFADREMPL